MKLLRRIFIGLVGGIVLFVGILMIVLPGPAFIVIPAGLAILAVEFAWARHYLNKMREYLAGKKNKTPDSSASSSTQSSLKISEKA